MSLVQAPGNGRLIAHTQQYFDTISSEAFHFSPFFACQEKPLLSAREHEGTERDTEAVGCDMIIISFAITIS